MHHSPSIHEDLRTLRGLVQKLDDCVVRYFNSRQNSNLLCSQQSCSDVTKCLEDVQLAEEVADPEVDSNLADENSNPVDSVEVCTETIKIPIDSSLNTISTAPLKVSTGSFVTLDISVESKIEDDENSPHVAKVFDKSSLRSDNGFLVDSTLVPLANRGYIEPLLIPFISQEGPCLWIILDKVHGANQNTIWLHNDHTLHIQKWIDTGQHKVASTQQDNFHLPICNLVVGNFPLDILLLDFVISTHPYFIDLKSCSFTTEHMVSLNFVIAGTLKMKHWKAHEKTCVVWGCFQVSSHNYGEFTGVEAGNEQDKSIVVLSWGPWKCSLTSHILNAKDLALARFPTSLGMVLNWKAPHLQVLSDLFFLIVNVNSMTKVWDPGWQQRVCSFILRWGLTSAALNSLTFRPCDDDERELLTELVLRVTVCSKYILKRFSANRCITETGDLTASGVLTLCFMKCMGWKHYDLGRSNNCQILGWEQNKVLNIMKCIEEVHYWHPLVVSPTARVMKDFMEFRVSCYVYYDINFGFVLSIFKIQNCLTQESHMCNCSEFSGVDFLLTTTCDKATYMLFGVLRYELDEVVSVLEHMNNLCGCWNEVIIFLEVLATAEQQSLELELGLAICHMGRFLPCWEQDISSSLFMFCKVMCKLPPGVNVLNSLNILTLISVVIDYGTGGFSVVCTWTSSMIISSLLCSNLEDKVLLEDGGIVMNLLWAVAELAQVAIGPQRSNKAKGGLQSFMWDPGPIRILLNRRGS